MTAIAETCDRCGESAAATTRFELPSGGSLTFCAHHSREKGPGLVALGATVMDLVKVAATTA